MVKRKNKNCKTSELEILGKIDTVQYITADNFEEYNNPQDCFSVFDYVEEFNKNKQYETGVFERKFEGTGDATKVYRWVLIQVKDSKSKNKKYFVVADERPGEETIKTLGKYCLCLSCICLIFKFFICPCCVGCVKDTHSAYGIKQSRNFMGWLHSDSFLLPSVLKRWVFYPLSYAVDVLFLSAGMLLFLLISYIYSTYISLHLPDSFAMSIAMLLPLAPIAGFLLHFAGCAIWLIIFISKVIYYSIWETDMD